MPRKPLYVKSWTEDYRGWSITFKIRARGEDGYLRTKVLVSEKWFFGLLTGRTRYSETADDWTIGKENIEEQAAELREGARGFINNMESAKDLQGLRPNPDA